VVRANTSLLTRLVLLIMTCGVWRWRPMLFDALGSQSETDLTRNLIISKSAYEYPAHFTVMHYFKFSQFIVSKRRFEPSASSYVAIIEYPSIFDKRSSRSKCRNAASIKCYESKGKRREQKMQREGRQTQQRGIKKTRHPETSDRSETVLGKTGNLCEDHSHKTAYLAAYMPLPISHPIPMCL
jgi:hypothetical protein